MRVRGRKLLAVLAGGVVLIGGGVTTLASWQDTEYAGLPLFLSSFDVQTSLDDQTWSSAEASSSPKNLVIALSGALTNVKLTPNGSITSWVGLRAAPNSNAATVTMSNFSVNTGNADLGLSTLNLPNSGGPAVTYDASSGISKSDCQSGSYTGGSAIASNSALGATLTSSSRTFTLDAGTNGAAGASVGICFKIKLADGISHLLGGAQLSPVWKFDATSQ